MKPKRYATIRELAIAVKAALNAAGEEACPLRRTRTTGRVRYEPGARGYRVVHQFSSPASVAASERQAVGVATLRGMRLAIRDGRHRVGVLRRYAAILRAAGFDAMVDRDEEHRARRELWVEPAVVFGRDGKHLAGDGTVGDGEE